MQLFYRTLFSVILTLGLFLNSNAQDLKINELMSANGGVIYDEDNDTPDWIEILNTGNSITNLSDYYISDESDSLQKWNFPKVNLNPGQPFLIFASGKNRAQVPLFWYTLIDVGHSWKYMQPTSEPSAAWKTISFSDSGWLTGASGFGFEDNDDATVIAKDKISVFLRKKFNIINLTEIKSLWLHMDYDDGFVAYLNGTEICRSGLGAAGSAVSFNQASAQHEANIYRGLKPDAFDLSSFIKLLKTGENILAIQVHNTAVNSSDFSAIPILSVGYSSKINLNAPVSKYVEAPVLYPHTNFKLSSSGETLYLTNKNLTITDTVKFDVIPGGFSYGREKNTPFSWGYFYQPTPGELNETAFSGDLVTSEVQFSIAGTFLKSASYLGLTGAATGEEIRFTTNGSEPTQSSTLVRGPVQITKNTTVRARIFKTGATPGKIASRTYIFDVQPTLPVISVTTDSMNLWDHETGIYVLGDTYENQNPYFGANFWEDWEKPASIEMTGTDGRRIFNANCGIKIFGAWSRARDQKSLAIFFRNEYGDPVLENVQLFQSKPITSFKSFVVRNAGNDYDYTRFRDGMMTDLVKNMHTDIQAFQPVVLYLNSKYWGHINLREKVNEDYLESNHHVDADQLDLLGNDAEVLAGSNADYLELKDYISKNSLVADASYEIAANQIDLDNYMDYMISQIYFDNRDWPGNNIKFWKPRTENGRWRWIMFDTDFGFGIYNNTAYNLNTLQFALEPNGPSWPNPAWSTLLFRKLNENTKFRYAFINRFADMLNTTFQAPAVIAHIDSMAAILRPEMERQYQRWSVPSVGWWETSVNAMRIFAQNRVPFMMGFINQQYSRAGIYEVTLSNSPASAGYIKLNTIEVAGNLWKGKYFENVPVKVTANALRGYKFHHWEVDGVTVVSKTVQINLKKATTFKAFYEEEVDDGNSVVINEINYNSPTEFDGDDWVEIFNWGRSDLDISGWVFSDSDDIHRFVVPQNTILKSREYLVLCQNASDFALIHAAITNILGDFDFGLGTSGDAVRLFDKTGQLVDEVMYESQLPWASEPSGFGPTLELRQYFYDNSNPDSWKPSVENLGTPGRENSVTTDALFIASTNSEKVLNIFPNPFTTETKLKIENGGFESMKVTIYAMDGRLVFKQENNGNEFVWNGKNQTGQNVPPGIYICKVQSGNEWFSEKIIRTR